MNSSAAMSDGFVIGIILLYGFFILLGLASLVFWIVEIVDVARRQFSEPNTKAIWLIVVILGHGIGAIVYYFAGRPNGWLPGETPRYTQVPPYPPNYPPTQPPGRWPPHPVCNDKARRRKAAQSCDCAALSCQDYKFSRRRPSCSGGFCASTELTIFSRLSASVEAADAFQASVRPANWARNCLPCGVASSSAAALAARPSSKVTATAVLDWGWYGRSS